MEQEYWVIEDEKTTGPWTQQQMELAWKLETLKPEMLCSVKGVEGWVKAGALDFIRKLPNQKSNLAPSRQTFSSITIFGVLLIAGGIIGTILTLYTDVSVSTEAGRVNNLGLIADKICLIIAFVGCVLFGGQLLILGATKAK